MALETVGKPRIKREEDLWSGIHWYSCIGEKSNGVETGRACGWGTTPKKAWESFCSADPFSIVWHRDDVDFDEIPF